jgi:hypothetical protein
MNPSTTQTAWARIFYYTDDGNSYAQDVTIPPRGRRTASPPASVPDGGFCLFVGSVDGSTFVVERSMYGGLPGSAAWELGTAETGVTTPAPRWLFAEGALSGSWDVIFLVMNPSWSATVPVTLTYRRTDGTVVTQNVTLPTRGRLAINPAYVMGGSVTYATEVTATNGAPIVVERAMYWPGWPNWLGSHVSAGRPQ